jgi:hypothetical protein
MKASWRWLIYRGSPQPGNPGAFVVRRRVELAARYMLTTDASLSDLALRCGFTAQPYLCKHFRQTTGYTPAARRRAHRSEMTVAEIALCGAFWRSSVKAARQ